MLRPHESCPSSSPPTLSFSPSSVSPTPGILSSGSGRQQNSVRKFLLTYKCWFHRPPRGPGQGARPVGLRRSLLASRTWGYLSLGQAGTQERGLCTGRTEQGKCEIQVLSLRTHGQAHVPCPQRWVLLCGLARQPGDPKTTDPGKGHVRSS